MPRTAAATPPLVKPANSHMHDESLITDHVKFPAWVLGVMTVEAQEQRRHRSYVIREIVIAAAKMLEAEHAAKDKQDRAASSKRTKGGR